MSDPIEIRKLEFRNITTVNDPRFLATGEDSHGAQHQAEGPTPPESVEALRRVIEDRETSYLIEEACSLLGGEGGPR